MDKPVKKQKTATNANPTLGNKGLQLQGLNIPTSPTSIKSLSKQKIRVVSPVNRGMNEDLDPHEIYGKAQEGKHLKGSIFTSVQQKVRESPEAFEDLTSVYNNKQSSGCKTKQKSKKSTDCMSAKIFETQLVNYQNMTMENDFNIQELNPYFNQINANHEKQKSMNMVMQEMSATKKQNQLSPKQAQLVVSMTKLLKNSSSNKTLNGQIQTKKKRKKSQEKIGHEVNEDDHTHKNQIIAIRSSSQPQLRSQSQQANSQERGPLMIKKKNLIKGVDQTAQVIILKKDLTKMIQGDNSVERKPVKQNGSIKVMLKKNQSSKLFLGSNVKINKDQIQLKYNSNSSVGQQQQIGRSRSLSNNKFINKKKSQPTLPKPPNDTQDQVQVVQPIKTDLANLLQTLQQALQNNQRSKSTTKLVGLQSEEQTPQNNSKKTLIFKTSNEENNAKMIALKSLIKMSSNADAGTIIQLKQGTLNNKETASQYQEGNQLGVEQPLQKTTLFDSNFVKKCASANPNKGANQIQQFMQRITSGRITNQTQTKEIQAAEQPNNVPLNRQKNDNSESQKLNQSGQVNIRNIKVNSTKSGEQEVNQTLNQSKVQIMQQQKMHYILMNQNSRIQSQLAKDPQSRNNQSNSSAFSSNTQSVKTVQQSSSANVVKPVVQNLIPKANAIESFHENQNQESQIKEQFSRKSSILSNGSIKTQPQTQMKENMNPKEGTQLLLNRQQNTDQSHRYQNSSQMTLNTFYNDSSVKNQFQTYGSQRLTMLSDEIKIQDHKMNGINSSRGPQRLDFQSQMSPTNEEAQSKYQGSKFMTPLTHGSQFMTPSGNIDSANDDDCLEDESMVIIQEDQLRLPMKSAKQSQSSNIKFFQDGYDCQPKKDELLIESVTTNKSVFKKKHEISIIEEDSLVTQVKTQLMKLHFQQAFQGDNQKKNRNTTRKEYQTIDDCNVSSSRRIKHSLETSGTVCFDPQFEDLSFELDTCNQIQVPKNMDKAIDQVHVVSLPEDCDIYREVKDPLTGTTRFTIEKDVVRIISPAIKKNIEVRQGNQVTLQEVGQYPDPLKDVMKQDYSSKEEEKSEEDEINKGIDASIHVYHSLSLQTSLCSSNNLSLNTFLSDDVTLNSNLFSQVLQNPGEAETHGIISYAAKKLNIREGDSLFLLPRLQEFTPQQFKLALLKRVPEWWWSRSIGHSTTKENEPVLETFFF